MPDQFGEDEGGEHEQNEGPRLKGRLVVRAGAVRKSTLQLVDGEQSQALARLIEKILEHLCGARAQRASARRAWARRSGCSRRAALARDCSR